MNKTREMGLGIQFGMNLFDLVGWVQIQKNRVILIEMSNFS